jgi:hypothetical protein
MTRISNLFVASTLAILPISAFAQQTAAPAKTAAPTSMTTPAPATTAPVTAPMTDKTLADKTLADKAGTGKTATAPTADVTKPAKPEMKTPAVGTKTPPQGAKSEVHGMNTGKTHHAKTSIPAKSAEPAKS